MAENMPLIDIHPQMKAVYGEESAYIITVDAELKVLMTESLNNTLWA
jgi:hypothetical protein